jgi:hypothetical protein
MGKEMAWGRKGSKSSGRNGGLRRDERSPVRTIEGAKRKRKERKRREMRRSSVEGFFIGLFFWEGTQEGRSEILKWRRQLHGGTRIKLKLVFVRVI